MTENTIPDDVDEAVRFYYSDIAGLDLETKDKYWLDMCTKFTAREVENARIRLYRHPETDYI